MNGVVIQWMLFVFMSLLIYTCHVTHRPRMCVRKACFNSEMKMYTMFQTKCTFPNDHREHGFDLKLIGPESFLSRFVLGLSIQT